MSPPTWLLILGVLLLTLNPSLSYAFERDDNSEYESREPDEKFNYYDIYKAIDMLRELTLHRTFYELLNVAPGADNDAVSRAFRKTSILYHPDKLRAQGKWDEKAEKLSQLVQSVGALLRTEEGRRQYDWVLNDAPPWHRQTVYVMGKFMRTSKLTVQQVILITFTFTIILQFFAQWIFYAVAWYMILSSRWALRAMGEKEVKRMRKRMIGQDPAFIAMNNTTYHTILLADSPPPPLPNPLKLWIFQLPLFILKSLYYTLFHRGKPSVKRTWE